MDLMVVTPAQLTKTSMVPKAANALAAADRGPSIVAKSALMATQRLPSASTAFETSAKPCSSRPTAAISAPASARTLQASSPMPLVAPVTRARLPSRECRLVHCGMFDPHLFLVRIVCLVGLGEDIV